MGFSSGITLLLLHHSQDSPQMIFKTLRHFSSNFHPSPSSSQSSFHQFYWPLCLLPRLARQLQTLTLLLRLTPFIFLPSSLFANFHRRSLPSHQNPTQLIFPTQIIICRNSAACSCISSCLLQQRKGSP